nr:MAG TPA: Rad52/22 family double-strand break repair protein [Caudoviricetes sp.]
MNLNFRNLKASEIDVKPQTVKDNGFSLLLYKNARVDMDVLDETVGPMNWQRKHSRENANCIVSIYDEDKKIWVEKEDTGTESFTEKEKGLASDSFKRACFNWGIGRELYTSPFIWISDSKYIKKNKEGKLTLTDKFSVKEITVLDKVITELEIIDSKGVVVFSTNLKTKSKKSNQAEFKKAIDMINALADTEEKSNKIFDMIEKFNKNSLMDCTIEELRKIYDELKK